VLDLFKELPQHLLDAVRNSNQFAKQSPDTEPFPPLRLVVESQRLRLKSVLQEPLLWEMWLMNQLINNKFLAFCLNI